MKFVVTLFVAVLAIGPVFAAPKAARKPVPQTQVQVSSPEQVDGIISSAVDIMWAETDEYWHHGDYPRIVALDRIITQADPSFVESYSTGGWLMESLGRTKDAEAFYQLGVATNPKKSYAYYSLGAFYFNTLKDYPAALAVMQKGAKQSDSGINDWRMLAHSYERVGAYDAAVETWQKIKVKFPNEAAIEVNLNRALSLQKAAQTGTKTPPSSPVMQ